MLVVVLLACACQTQNISSGARWSKSAVGRVPAILERSTPARPLSALIMRAYGVKRFDVSAKVPDQTTKDRVSIMLRNLLLDRFDLRAHHETKLAPVYELLPPRSQESSRHGGALCI